MCITSFWCMVFQTMWRCTPFLFWENLCQCKKQHIYVPSMYMITCKRWTISFDKNLDHLGLYRTLMRCLYCWDSPVSGHRTVFRCYGWIVTSPVASLVTIQYYLVWHTKVGVIEGGVGVGFLGEVNSTVL